MRIYPISRAWSNINFDRYIWQKKPPMIIYGTKAKQLKQETLFSEKCASCEKQNVVDMFIIQRWFHVFWIPFFPIGKVGVSQCSHCKNMLKEKEMTPQLRMAAANLKSQSKTPLFTFIGLALLIVLISFTVVENQKDNARDAALVKQPRPGDVYEIRTTDGKYTMYKVAKVNKDTAFVYISLFESNKSTGLNQLLEKEFTEDFYAFTVKELIDMQAKGEIMDVNRR
jgi:hypothetical protein